MILRVGVVDRLSGSGSFGIDVLLLFTREKSVVKA